MDASVWVDSWQQQCCGKTFVVSSAVRWTVNTKSDANDWLTTLFGQAPPGRADYAEEHHGEADGSLTGTVRSIEVITCKRVDALPPPHAPNRTIRVPVPSSGRLRSVQVIDDWEPERPDRLAPGWSFEGWLVTLSDAQFELLPTTSLTSGISMD